MIIWVASYPRSGNTFFRVLLRRMLGVNTYTVYPQPVPNMEELGELPFDKTIAAAARSKHLYFLKTHELPGADKYPAIYLVRDGRDSLVSHTHYTLADESGHTCIGGGENAVFNNVLHGLVATAPRFGGWSANIRAWCARAAPTHVIRFEELIRNPEATFRRAIRALDCKLPVLKSATAPEFEALHKSGPKWFRKGLVGSWKQEMPHGLATLFAKLHGDTMRELKYDCPRVPESLIARLLEHNYPPDLARTRHVEHLYSGELPPDGVFLGDGWFPLEASDGRTFRWAGADAEIVVTAPTGAARKLLLEVEPGPGTCGRPLELGILDAEGRVILEKTVAYRTAVMANLPQAAGLAVPIKLKARNGGIRAATDPRVLNFRVFDLALAK